MIEGAAAGAALKQGVLEHHDPSMHEVTYEAAQEVVRAFAVWEAAELRKESTR